MPVTLHAAPGQIERRLASHAAAPPDEIVVTIAGAGRGVDEHDVERLKGMADTLELSLDVGRRTDVTVGLVAEVELHAASETPFERHFVDRPGALAAVHRRVIVPRRVKMRAGMGGDLAPLARAALAFELLVDRHAGHLLEFLRPLVVTHIFDLGQKRRWIGSDTGFQRDGKVNETTGHGKGLLNRKKGMGPAAYSPG